MTNEMMGHELHPEGCLHQLFEAAADRQPDAEALTCRGQSLSYAELDRRANRLAHRLRCLCVGPEVLVGFLAERSLEMVVGILGVLKAGGAYVPLDPSEPLERQRLILEDMDAKVLLGHRHLLERLPAARAALVFLDDAGGLQDAAEHRVSTEVSPQHLAYVIFTSGSTGRPKGVLVEHQSIVHLVRWHQRAFCVTAADRASQLASLGFDAAVWEMWPYLTAGASLHLSDASVRESPLDIPAWFRQQRITIAFLPTPWADLVLRREWPRDGTLRILLTGGDRLRFHPGALPFTLVNAYGPTEATVVSTAGIVPVLGSGPPSIGRAIDGVDVHLLDDARQPVSPGAVGEIYVGGTGVARGYLNRPALTAASFIHDPFSPRPGARLYRTGDLGRSRPDGSLEFVGRLDQQVKIRGYRVELEEVESTLLRHPGVEQGVVKVTPDDRLAAYFVPKAQDSRASADLLSSWQRLYEDTYAGESTAPDGTFDLRGWASSYTGRPIPDEQMRDWVNNAVDRIRTIEPRRVLEIGCGTGLLLHRLASSCELYWATDFSIGALARVRREFERSGRGQPNMVLLHRRADDFEGIEPGTFDTVILNSVIQYFPDVEYLQRVLEGAVQAIGTRGTVFVGDVRSLPLLTAFHTSKEIFSAKGDVSCAELRRRVERAVRQEEELLIAPELFLMLKARHSRITRVQIRLQRGRLRNEMNRFRYDVIFHIGRSEPKDSSSVARPPETTASVDWGARCSRVDDVRRMLAEPGRRRLCIRRVPNARVCAAVRAFELLGAADCPASASEIRKAAFAREREAVDPEDLWALAETALYSADIGWSGSRAPDCFDVVFTRVHEARASLPLEEVLETSVPLANDPRRPSFERQLSSALRGFMKDRLPEYMVPSELVAVDELPRLPSGKIDRTAPSISWTASRPRFLAPRTQVEEQLTKIWAEVLGLDRVGVEDDFLDCGGDSLLGMQIISRIVDAFGVSLSLGNLLADGTPARLSILLDGKTRNAPGPIRRRSPMAVPPLSFTQEGILLDERLHEGEFQAYSEVLAIHLEGALSMDALGWSLNEVVRRHEILRTTISTRDGVLTQVVGPYHALPVSETDGTAWAPEGRDALLRRLARQEAEQGFDLGKGPLIRARLVRFTPHRQSLLLNIHHIAVDEWSTAVIVRELSALYGAFLAGRPSPLHALPVQYADYAIWQRESLHEDATKRHVDFFRRALGGALSAVDAPRGRPRHGRGDAHDLCLSASLAEALRELSRREGVTPFVILVSAFATLLGLRLRREHILLAVPVAVRPRRELEELIGPFLNVVVFQTDLRGDPSFRDVLLRVRDAWLATQEHQELPFERLVTELETWRRSPQSPRFHAVFALQNVPRPSPRIGDLDARVQYLNNGAAKADLVMSLEERDGGFSGFVEYALDAFDSDAIRHLVRSYESLLDGVVADPDLRLSALPVPVAEPVPRTGGDRGRASGGEAATWSRGSGASVPRTPLERRLTLLFGEVLGRDPVGIFDDFFELGGHSLLAMRLAIVIRDRLGIDVPAPWLFDAPTVAELAAKLSHRSADRPPAPGESAGEPIPIRGDLSAHPASMNQIRLAGDLNDADGRSNAAITYELLGPLNVEALQHALEALVDRHETLRARFSQEDGHLTGSIGLASGPERQLEDLTGYPAVEREALALAKARRSAALPFDLREGPLFRVNLFKLGERRHVLLLLVHHLIFDGYSLGLFFEDLDALYAAAHRGVPAALPELPIQYADFAAWQIGFHESAESAAQIAYWQGRLRGAKALLLPTDHPRDGVNAGRASELRPIFNASIEPWTLTAPLFRALLRCSRQESTTLNVTLLAAFVVLLSRLARQEDIVVSTANANRHRPGTDRLIGAFAQALLLRVDLSGGPTFRTILRQVRDALCDARARADVFGPFLEPAKHRISFNYLPLAPPRLGDLDVVPLPQIDLGGTPWFDLVLGLFETPTGVNGAFRYNRELFKPATITRWTQNYDAILHAVEADLDCRYLDLPAG